MRSALQLLLRSIGSLCCLLRICIPPTQYQEIQFKVQTDYQYSAYHLGKEQGLNGNLPYNMFQDSKGFIWFAAHNLVQRYDGRRFENFLKFTPKSKFAAKIMEDKQERIWVLIGYTADERAFVDDLWLISADRKQIWSWPEIMEKYQLTFSLQHITAYHYDAQMKAPLLGLNDGRLVELSDGEQIIGHWPNMAPISKVETNSQAEIFVASNNRIVLSTPKGEVKRSATVDAPIISMYWNTNEELEYKLANQPEQRFTLTWDDRRGSNVPLPNFEKDFDWLSRYTNDWILTKHRIYSVGRDQPIFECEQCPRLYSDHQQNIWTSNYKGLTVINVQPRWFQTMLADQGIETRGILPLSDSLFMVHSYKGTFVLDLKGQVLHHNPTLNGFLNSGEKKNGEIWSVGPVFGLHRIINDNHILREQGQIETLINTPEEPIIPLFDPQGSLWIGTSHGLYKCNIGSDGALTDCKEVEHPQMRGVTVNYLEYVDEHLWVATSKGLFEVDPSSPEAITHHSVLSHLDVMHFLRDSSCIWLATLGDGLVRWEYGTDQYRNDFLGQQIASILHTPPPLCAVYDDHLGYLWIPSYDGLYRLKKSDWSYRVFYKEHNVAHNEFNRHSHARLPNGHLVFGGLSGITVVDPQRMLDAEWNSSGFKIEIYNGTVGNATSTQVITLENGKPIRLMGQQDDLKFECAILDYRTNKKGTVLYKVEGVYNEWRSSEDHRIHLDRLPFGSHTLRVKAQSFDNIMSTNEWSIPIESMRPWYLQSWFRLLMIVAIFAAGLGAAHYRNRSMRQAKAVLEEQVKLRTAEIMAQNELIISQNKDLNLLNDYKDKIMAIIGHDLRSPVIGLRNLGRKINFLRERDQMDRLVDFSQELDSRIENLTYLIDNILAWTLVQKGQDVEFHDTVVELDRLVKEQILLAQSAAVNKDQAIIIEKECAVSFPAPAFILGVLVRNILTNSIKYSSAGSRILVRISAYNEAPCLTVLDEGSGMSVQLRQRLNQYSQGDTTVNFNPGGPHGMGLGLWICGSLLKNLKGKWSFSPGPDGTGLEVKIWFPTVAPHQ